MKLFENCKVQSTEHPELNGLIVKKTIRWCYNGDMAANIYEVKLSDGKNYQLDEKEMILDDTWKKQISYSLRL